MRYQIVLVAVVVALGLSGCGDRQLLLGVDALSFTDPATRDLAFGPVPALPDPLLTGELPVFDDLHVNMFGGAKDVVDVQSVTITFSADIADSTGDGLDTLRVYLSDSATSPTTTPPVIVVPIVLAPGQHSPVHAVIAGDPRVNALFTQDKMRVTLTTSLRGPSSGQSLNGRLVVTELRANVVARHHSSL
jgi:hypothetical protein